jgi:hypothetical protein
MKWIKPSDKMPKAYEEILLFRGTFPFVVVGFYDEQRKDFVVRESSDPLQVEHVFYWGKIPDILYERMKKDYPDLILTLESVNGVD